MNVTQKRFAKPSVPVYSEEYDYSFSSDSEPKNKPCNRDQELGYTSKSGGMVRNFVSTSSLGKSQSICNINNDSAPPSRIFKTDANESPNKMALRRGGSHMETDAESNEAKIRGNSLISIMVSTIMCLAVKCPVPKSNIQTTKTFLSTIHNDVGETPRNIKGLLNILQNYTGPYQGDSTRSVKSEKIPSDVGQGTKEQENVKEVSSNSANNRIRSRFSSQPMVRKNSEQKRYLRNP